MLVLEEQLWIWPPLGLAFAIPAPHDKVGGTAAEAACSEPQAGQSPLKLG